MVGKPLLRVIAGVIIIILLPIHVSNNDTSPGNNHDTMEMQCKLILGKFFLMAIPSFNTQLKLIRNDHKLL